MKKTKQEEAKQLLDSFFTDGGIEKFNFNETVRTGANPFLLSEKRILDPSKGDYITIRKWIRALADNTLAKYGEGSSFVRYNALLMVLAAMELCISDEKMERWQADPMLQFLNQQEGK